MTGIHSADIHSEPSILISGAGPVGCTLALHLASKTEPARIVLRGVFEAGTAAKVEDPAPSPRTLALNQGSCALLAALGVDVRQTAGADILTVHVSQKGRLGRTLIEHHLLNQPRLGRVVTYATLLQHLQRAVRASGVTLQPLPEHPCENACLDETEHLPQPALHIIADGQPPPQWQRSWQRDYGQHAVLAVVRASHPRPQWAFERFTREGPLALLPHPCGADLYSLVWCCPPDAAQTRTACEPAVFEAALQTQFGERLGRLTLLESHQSHQSQQPLRLHVPLTLYAGPPWTGGRRVVIGNAAQTLHPVAGQGLNLALRDVAQLVQVLAPWLHRSKQSPEHDPAPLLQRYAQKRQWDRCLTLGVTDLLPRVFSTGHPLVEHACGLALTALDTRRRLRLPLARHLLQGLRS